MLDESKTHNVNSKLNKIVGDGIKLNITYGKDDATFQNSYPNQKGKCSTIIDTSKSKPDRIEDADKRLLRC